MLDVHIPHGRLTGIREFLLHLFTISCGLIIAVQIESFVEWRHHQHLADEARQSMRHEIEQNLQYLQLAQHVLEQWRQDVEQDHELLKANQKDPSGRLAQGRMFRLYTRSTSLPDTAWRTAQAAGALAFMPYAEAERFSEIYQIQQSLIDSQTRPFDDVAAVMGRMAENGVDPDHIGAAQARLLDAPIEQLRLHLAETDGILLNCIEHDQAYLQNRQPQGDFTQNLKN
jgi:hypothetical protein